MLCIYCCKYSCFKTVLKFSTWLNVLGDITSLAVLKKAHFYISQNGVWKKKSLFLFSFQNSESVWSPAVDRTEDEEWRVVKGTSWKTWILKCAVCAQTNSSVLYPESAIFITALRTVSDRTNTALMIEAFVVLYRLWDFKYKCCLSRMKAVSICT